MKSILILLGVYFGIINASFSQSQSDSINNKFLNRVIIAEASLYSVSMIGLGAVWYQGNENQKFQFFNDNQQWLQMDKAGHIYSAYHISNLNFNLLQKAGYTPKKAMLFSSISASLMMLPIEIFDGFSTAYGASVGDAVANTIGAFLPYQQLLFNQNYIYPKFSFSRTNYADLRPNTLGNNYIENILKDYNGQTYWLSTDFNLFSSQNRFPNWLQFSIGYSGNNMLYGNPDQNLENGYMANRQWFLSLDLNLEKIESDKKWVKTALAVINIIKIPFPTVEWNGKTVILHPIYF
ncbi:DUF2279 domain-containing protein [Marivirga arenosa]|uniref:DUF2279 domain-containing protein n=1 Tax=Marivirga arenosa TaxID=3059076 RepID=A0AA51X521_9BACT|nr:DUF2279 domain-containing protein [Marivirga sp. BKB1-2]WNB17238.1 DUF2279 domain-containing protein [Marivirga sp. BKB1-2]